jgi:hypothetical protein
VGLVFSYFQCLAALERIFRLRFNPTGVPAGHGRENHFFYRKNLYVVRLFSQKRLSFCSNAGAVEGKSGKRLFESGNSQLSTYTEELLCKQPDKKAASAAFLLIFAVWIGCLFHPATVCNRISGRFRYEAVSIQK